jgi:hypothetical protein
LESAKSFFLKENIKNLHFVASAEIIECFSMLVQVRDVLLPKRSYKKQTMAVGEKKKKKRKKFFNTATTTRK